MSSPAWAPSFKLTDPTLLSIHLERLTASLSEQLQNSKLLITAQSPRPWSSPLREGGHHTASLRGQPPGSLPAPPPCPSLPCWLNSQVTLRADHSSTALGQRPPALAYTVDSRPVLILDPTAKSRGLLRKCTSRYLKLASGPHGRTRSRPALPYPVGSHWEPPFSMSVH